MTSVLLRAFSFTLVIVIGIVMRSSGLVSSNAGDAVKKFLIYITLPAAIITNFSAITDIGAEMVLIALLGIIANVIMIAAGALITRHRTRGEQALNMLCLPAFNIGAFCLPFVQSFLPALGSVTACMFDVGKQHHVYRGNVCICCRIYLRKQEGAESEVIRETSYIQPSACYICRYVYTVSYGPAAAGCRPDPGKPYGQRQYIYSHADAGVAVPPGAEERIHKGDHTPVGASPYFCCRMCAYLLLSSAL